MKWEIDAFVNCFFLFSPTLNCVVVVVFYFATFCFSFSLCSFLCLFNLHLIAALPPRGGAPCMKRATCAFHLHAHIFISSQRGRGTGEEYKDCEPSMWGVLEQVIPWDWIEQMIESAAHIIEGALQIELNVWLNIFIMVSALHMEFNMWLIIDWSGVHIELHIHMIDTLL